MRAFLDTNVLVYLFDADNPTRRDQAAALLARQQEDLDLVVSTQVLQEFYVAASANWPVRYPRKPLSAPCATLPRCAPSPWIPTSCCKPSAWCGPVASHSGMR